MRQLELGVAVRTAEPFERWTYQSWFAEIDLAVVNFLTRLDKGVSFETLLAAAICSQQAQQGHTCIDLTALCAEPETYLHTSDRVSQLNYHSERRAANFEETPVERIKSISPEAWLKALRNDSCVSNEGIDDAPLVLEGNRLYLRRFWRAERSLAEMIAERLKQAVSPPSSLATELTRLFGAQQDAQQPDWQAVACALASRSALSIITGGPGTGKTTTVARLIALLCGKESDFAPSILLAAPTGKAAARLSESVLQAPELAFLRTQTSAHIELGTLHRILGIRPDLSSSRYDQNRPLPHDLIIVDEVSMIDLELFVALMRAVKPGARLVLLGDKDQLASVEAGAVLAELCRDSEQAGYSPHTCDWLRSEAGIDLGQWLAEEGKSGDNQLAQAVTLLRRSYRFSADSGISQFAAAVNQGDRPTLEQLLNTEHADLELHAFSEPEDPELARLIRQGFGAFRDQLGRIQPIDLSNPELESLDQLFASLAAFRILLPTRKGGLGTESINRLCERALNLGVDPASAEAVDSHGYPGRVVMVTRNNYQLGVRNGDLGVCLPVQDRSNQPALRLVFEAEEGGYRWIAPERLTEVDTAFAMTIHKSQGSEFDRVLVLMPKVTTRMITRELVYTAVTRARSVCALSIPEPEVLFAAAATPTERASGLYSRLAEH